MTGKTDLPSGGASNKKGSLAKRVETALEAAAAWAGEAYNAAEGRAPEFRRGQRIFVVVTLTLLLLTVGAIFCVLALFAMGSTTEEHIPGVPSGVRLGVYLWPLIKVFLVFLILLHLLAYGLSSLGKTALHAMEYAYLLLASLGLLGIVSVGVDENISTKKFYADQLSNVRSGLDFYIEDAHSRLCGENGPTATIIPKVAICRWLEQAKALAYRQLDENAKDDNTRIGELLKEGDKLIAITKPQENSSHLTDNQKAGLFNLRHFLEDA
jgi:hypothetical protein